jgi:succinate dehydrogenase / fumarate reductase cytochrome b subunit
MYKSDPARPVTLPLLKLRLPLAGWVSLMHRVSGVFLFLCLPLVLYALEQSLQGAESFEQIQRLLMQPMARIALLLLVWALAHHLFAGIRHLLMDLHWGVSLAAARRSGVWVMIASGAVVVFTAWRLFA